MQVRLTNGEWDALVKLVELYEEYVPSDEHSGYVLEEDLARALGLYDDAGKLDTAKHEELKKSLRSLNQSLLIAPVHRPHEGRAWSPGSTAVNHVRHAKAEAAKSPATKLLEWVKENLKKGAEQTVQKSVYLAFSVVGGMLGALIIRSC